MLNGNGLDLPLYYYPQQIAEANAAQRAGKEYMLTGDCIVCGQTIFVKQCIYGFEPRCGDHELISERDSRGFDKLSIALIEVRTAPFKSTIILDPNPHEQVYLHGAVIPNTPGWTYLGCPAVVRRMRSESPEEQRTRAQAEAEAMLNDGFYREVEY